MPMYFYIGILLAIWNSSLVNCQTRESFIHALLTEYDSRIPPNFEKDVPCVVDVGLHINSIDSINEQGMEFTLSAFITQTWGDSRLQFRNLIEADYLELDARLIDKVWVPDLYFRNEKRAHFHTVTIPNKMLHIYENGTVVYRSRVSLTASCPMDLQLYPMDHQRCSLIIQSWSSNFQIKKTFGVLQQWAFENIVANGLIARNERLFSLTKSLPVAYTSNRLVFRWDEDSPVTFDTELALPQFTLGRKETTNCSYSQDGKKVSETWHGNTCLQLDIYLRRNIGFYMIHIYVPSCLVVMLSWLSFWLHVDAVPARVTLGILTVLTVTTQRTSSTSSLPQVSYIKAIDIWMAVSLCFVFCALLEYACVNVLDRRCKRKLAKMPMVVHELQNGKTEETSAVGPSWKPRNEALMVDNLSRVVFPVSYLIFVICYYITYNLRD